MSRKRRDWLGVRTRIRSTIPKPAGRRVKVLTLKEERKCIGGPMHGKLLKLSPSEGRSMVFDLKGMRGYYSAWRPPGQPPLAEKDIWYWWHSE